MHYITLEQTNVPHIILEQMIVHHIELEQTSVHHIKLEQTGVHHIKLKQIIVHPLSDLQSGPGDRSRPAAAPLHETHLWRFISYSEYKTPLRADDFDCN